MIHRQAGRRSANAAVEFAVVLPFLAFITLVAVDFCRVFYYTLTIVNCARNGAQYASAVFNTKMQYGTGDGTDAVKKATIADGANLKPPLQDSDVTVTETTSNGENVVRVRVVYTFSTITSFPGIPSTITIDRTEEMRVAPQTPYD
ncbi:MAG: hypothetical protein KatS3mg105_2343 [Gemmatales bacterium]|nr:MAG: hypothetical protein KatS3mg105_2343 [Gemmatales bacterium]